jgi:hypothetical protein
LNIPPTKPIKQRYRSYKKFNIDAFISDLQNAFIPDIVSEADTTYDINHQYQVFENKISQIADKHAPIKCKFPHKARAIYECTTPKGNL